MSTKKKAVDKTKYSLSSLRGRILTPFFVSVFVVTLLSYLLLLQLEGLSSVRRTLILLFLAAIAAILLLAYQLSVAVLSQLDFLQQAVDEVAAGNLNTPLPTSSKNMGELGHRFNEIVGQLRDRNVILRRFSQYVGDQIAAEILDKKVEPAGGRNVTASVLFADIRDFTHFAAKSELQDLLAELNEYYEAMQEVIEQHGGVINKFGGDSLLAIFGAIHEDPLHGHHATEAAAAMLTRLKHLNSSREGRGLPPFSIGIGVNSGSMIVGHLGSDLRREFTVLGDTVNVAKRLSDMNKETPFHSIFMSASTHHALGTIVGWHSDLLGQFFIKGKVEELPVYALMPEDPMISSVDFPQPPQRLHALG